MLDVRMVDDDHADSAPVLPLQASCRGERFTQPVQVTLVVFFREQAGFAIVSALHNVQRDVIELDPWAAGHGTILHQNK
jgi:hypothetical protein